MNYEQYDFKARKATLKLNRKTSRIIIQQPRGNKIRVQVNESTQKHEETKYAGVSGNKMCMKLDENQNYELRRKKIAVSLFGRFFSFLCMFWLDDAEPKNETIDKGKRAKLNKKQQRDERIANTHTKCT